MCFRGFSLKTAEKHPPKGTLQAEGRVWRRLMAFHLRELQKRSQQSTGSAAKLLQANQLKHHSLEDGSEQSSTVWIIFFFFFPFIKRALEQIPFSPTKRATSPCRENQPRGTGECPRVGWEGAAAFPARHGHSPPVSCSRCHPVGGCWLPGGCPKHGRGGYVPASPRLCCCRGTDPIRNVLCLRAAAASLQPPD